MLVEYEVVMPNFLTSAAIVTQNLREGKTMKACGHNNLGERESSYPV